jgi:glycerol-3-phosphate dehydrogenase (NAD(P)+)
MEGAAAIRVICGALGKLTERGVVEPGDFPLMRHLYEVIGRDQPRAVPWESLFPAGAAEGLSP